MRVKQIEGQIRDLQKEQAEIQKDQSALRLQPCRGDLEIRQKEEKLLELDRRVKGVREGMGELERKRQELIAEPIKKQGYESPFS